MGTRLFVGAGLCGAYWDAKSVCTEQCVALSTQAGFVCRLRGNFFDVTLSLACFFGIGALMERYVWLQTGTLLIGGILVLTIGVGLLRKKTQIPPTESGKALSVGALLKKACIVTWCNPQAILDGTMMLGAFRAVLPATQSIVFLFGVVSASCVWFLGFTLLVSLLGQRFSSAVLRVINVLCGAVLVFYGANLLLQFIKLTLGGT